MRKNNKTLSKRTKIFLLSSLIFVLLFANFLLSYHVLHTTHVTIIENVSEKTKVIHKKLSFIAVGDALIHNGVYLDAQQKEKDTNGYYQYDFKSMFTDIKDIIKNYDLKFYNQETIIGGKNRGVSTYPRFNSPDEVGLDLIDAGFNIVNLATNHTLDKGEKAILYSRKFWKGQDVLAIGSYDSFEDRDQIIIQKKNGITYAILGYTTVTNGLKVPSGKEYLLNVYNKDKVKEDIEKVRDKVDVLIVSMHWGVEYTHQPTSQQREIASYLSSLGVDVVIGHHPHVIEPIEYTDDTLVIYSLGNFISAQDGEMKRVGMIVAFAIEKTKEGLRKEVSITNVKADLLWTYHENYKHFRVIPFAHLTDRELKGHEQIYEKYKKYITSDEKVKIGFIE